VNAAGPWVAQTLSSCLGLRTKEKVRLVQGSHVVVPQLFDHDRSYVFQKQDGRIVFAIPYEGAYTLIGTTEVDYAGDPGRAIAGAEEIAYLCKAASEYFAKPISPGEVVWSFSGVRPLHDDHVRDANAATRDYVLELDAEPGRAPLLSIIGGKITTYRRLAEAALERLAPYLPSACRQSAGWTRHAPLPGGDFDVNGLATLTNALATEFAFLSAPQVSRLAAAYGTRARNIPAGARTKADLGISFGATLTQAEVRYLMTEEWAQTAADVLWRRTKLGLALSDGEASALDRFMLTVSGVGEAAPQQAV
jgi:glycerol-3-phosphate dehydrogenase